MRGKPLLALTTTSTIVMAGLLVPANSAHAEAPSITIEYPLPPNPSDLGKPQKVAAGPLTVRGVTSGAESGEVTSVLFAVDVSGSTAWYTGNDCDGDGVPGQDTDDFNMDGNVGDILDCEIGAVISLNAALRALPNANSRIQVGLIPFGTNAGWADMSPESGWQDWVAPGATGGERDLIPYVNAAAVSMRQGSMDRFSPMSALGTGTDFSNPIRTAVDAFASRTGAATNGPAWVFFLSDGEASAPDMSAAAAAGIKVKTFAVNQPSCNSALNSIAQATGQDCLAVPNPSALPSEILKAESNIESIKVTLQRVGESTVTEKVATIDALGNFSADFGEINRVGTYHAIATIKLKTGETAVSATREFSVVTGKKYVALGDSYSSGEGNAPYVDQVAWQYEYRYAFLSIYLTRYETTAGFLCHRSQAGWPRQVTWPGSGTPLSQSDPDLFDFVACSGARITDMDTQGQPKEYYGCPQWGVRGEKVGQCVLPLQLTRVGTDTDLITISMGGNDIGFGEILKHCLSQFDCWEDGFIDYRAADGSRRSLSLDTWATLRLAMIQKELKGLYSAIRARVRPDTKVLAVTYPYIYDDSGSCSTTAEKRERTWIGERIDEFDNRLIALSRVPALGLQVADIRQSFPKEHSLCGSGEDWLHGLSLSRSTDLDAEFGGVVSAGSYHPNASGVAAYAKAVNTKLATNSTPPARANSRRQEAESAGTTESAEETLQDPEDPDVVLARYPAEVQSAVATTSFATIQIGSRLAEQGAQFCDAAVPNELVPFAARGFKQGSSVAVNLTWEGKDPVAVGTYTADASGAVSGEFAVPADSPTDKPLTVAVRGTNPLGGQAIGFAASAVAADPECIAQVQAAGAMAPTPTPTTSASTAFSATPTGGPSPSTPTATSPTTAPPAPEPAPNSAGPTTAAPAGDTRASSGTALTSSAKKTRIGNAVTLTATVTGPATGVVKFYDSGHALGIAPLRDGKATLVTKKIFGGVQKATARFAGDAAFKPSAATLKIRVQDTTKPSLVLRPLKETTSAGDTQVSWVAKDKGGIRAVLLSTKLGKGKWSAPVTTAPPTRHYSLASVAQGTRLCVRATAVDWAGNTSQRAARCTTAK